MPHKQPSQATASRSDKSVGDDTILKISKEIAVKFIEVGRLTPATFDETFKSIYRTIEEAVTRND